MATNRGGLGREEDVFSFVSNLLPEAAPGLDVTGISGGPSELIMISQRPDYCTPFTHLSFRYLWVIYHMLGVVLTQSLLLCGPGTHPPHPIPVVILQARPPSSLSIS